MAPSSRCRRVASTRRSRRAPRRPTSRSARRASGATRTRSRARSSRRSCACTGSSGSARSPRRWRPRSSRRRRSSWPTGRTSCARRRRKVLFDGFARVYTEGRDDDAADDDEETGRLPALAEGDRTTRRRGHADPALHRAAAALHRGDAHQGARGARHRPAVDLRRDDLDDHRPRLRPGRGAPAASRAGRRDRDRPARRALRRLRRRRVHRADGGGARRGRPRRARMGAAAARLLRRRCATASTRSAASSSAATSRPRRPTRSARKATRWSSGSAATAGSWPARCIRSTRRRRPLPGDEPPPQEGTGEVCPKCGEGTLVGKRGRFGPFVGCSRYPDCDYIKKDGPPPPDPLPFEVTCPKNKDGHLVPRRARRTGNVFWGCSNYPQCDFTTNHEPLGGLHDTDDGPLARKGEEAICLICGSTSDTPPDGDRPGRALRGRPAEPRGARPSGARPRRPTGWWREQARRSRRVAAPGPADARRHDGPARSSRPRTRERRAGRRRDPIPRWRGSSAPSPPATRRRTPGVRMPRPSAPISIGWLGAGRTGGPRHAPTCAPIWPCSARATRARRSPSGWLPSARSTAGPPGTAWRRVTPGAPSPRPVCRADCRVSSRSSRSLACSTSSRATSRHAGRRPRPDDAPRRPGAARSRDRRDRLRRGPADQRAGLGRSRVARPAARRGAGPGQGPQGADRPARSARPGEALADYLEDGRPVLLDASPRRRGAARARSS